ncbi:MAG TPA: aminoacetone oxidase family FAD-binding enzyme [Opitutaceae bacterium]|jgi:hypothetical protein
MSDWDAVIAGGGAAGFFAAAQAAERGLKRILLLEATTHVLSKVRISGGGRCNVTHACFEPKRLAGFYPRGGRELLGAFHRWQPGDTVAWFAARGVELKTEEDGRMFPVTDNSGTIVECLTRAVRSAGVELRLQAGVRRATARPEGGLNLEIGDGEPTTARSLLLATGGTRGSAGFGIAESLGHAIEPLVPSLFTFHIDDARLKGLEGLSVPAAKVAVPGMRLETTGPVLITHTGLSGPGILKLSAWGAREMAARDYRFPIVLNWCGAASPEDARRHLESSREGQHRRQRVANWNPFGLPSRLWERLAATAGASDGAIWANSSKPLIANLAQQVAAGEYVAAGKSLNKEEFVTCGGVRLSEVDFRTMESKRCPGLYFAGEVLDIDGLTGGFNFQAAWTTAAIAAEAMANASSS